MYELRNHHNELRTLFEADQADRRTLADGKLSQPELNVRDIQRRQRLEELVADGVLISSDDYYYAAYLLQHGTAPEEYRRTLDRWLVSRGEQQQYGTQYVRVGPHGYAIYTIDPQVSDEERAQYDVPPLGEQLRTLTERNGGWPVPWVQRLNGKLQIIEPDDAPDAGPVHLIVPVPPNE